MASIKRSIKEGIGFILVISLLGASIMYQEYRINQKRKHCETFNFINPASSYAKWM